MTTLTHCTSTIAWRITTCTEPARIVSQSLITTLTLMAQVLSAFYSHLHSIHVCVGCLSLTRPTPHSTSQPSLLSVPFFHLSYEQQAGALHEGHGKPVRLRYQRGVRTPTTSSTSTHIDDHHFKEEELKSVGELSKVCSQIVLKCLYLARIGRPDILWSVSKLARSITKWTKACDKRICRLISNIHHTCDYKQYCHLGNTVKQCRLGLFQDSDFAGDLEDSKSTSGGSLCIFGSHTFVPISWMCKKQTSVSHSSTESEIISLDAGLRLDGIPVLDLSQFLETRIRVIKHGETCVRTNVKFVQHLTQIQKRKQSQGMIYD